MSFFKSGFGAHAKSFAPKTVFGQNDCAPGSDGDDFGGKLFGSKLFGRHDRDRDREDDDDDKDHGHGKHHHGRDWDRHDNDDDDCDDDKDTGGGTGFPDIPNDTLGVTFSIDLNGDGVDDDYLFVEADPAADPTQTTLGDYYNAVSEDLKDSYPGYDPSKVVVKATIYSASEGESYYHFTGDEVAAEEEDDCDKDDEDDKNDDHHGGHRVWSGWKGKDDEDEDDKDCDDEDDDHEDSKFYKFVMSCKKDDEDDKDEDRDDEEDESSDDKFLFC